MTLSREGDLTFQAAHIPGTYTWNSYLSDKESYHVLGTMVSVTSQVRVSVWLRHK